MTITQSGFRCNNSTSTALLKGTDDLFKACDDHKNTCLILLDYSKAFEALDHGLLDLKLKYFSVNAGALAFFRDYFSNRQQRVVFREGVSGFLPIIKGVAQGSVIGPLMFSVYTSDFCRYIKHCFRINMQTIYSCTTLLRFPKLPLRTSKPSKCRFINIR